MEILQEMNDDETSEHPDVYNRNVTMRSLRRKRRREQLKRVLFYVLCVFCPIVAFLVFVLLPLVFMNSIALQRMLIFTHFNLPREKQFYYEFYQPGFTNRYVEVKDLDGISNITLGIWHLLPVALTYEALHNVHFDYADALKNSKYDVLLYFHGTGECRGSNTRKYALIRNYFHVITFDYRSYGDSSSGILSEDAVVNDCIQLYKWLLNQTNSHIYVWGHSLGTALATRTVSSLWMEKIVPKGLVLESAFTSMRDEIYVHPYGKIFAWLPWFKVMILNPLTYNGFVFNTAVHILNVSCPIMILHAEDDKIVPYRFGRQLYQIARFRPPETQNMTIYHEFNYTLEYGHTGICSDPFLLYYMRDFIEDCQNSCPVGKIYTPLVLTEVS